jgi:hypothetical protein
MRAISRVVCGLVALLSVYGCGEVLAPNTEHGLRVWAEVSPAVVRASDSAAVLRIRVYTANPSGRELRIRSGGPPYVFAGDPAQTRGLAQGYRLARGDNQFTAGPTTDWGWDTVYVFRPRASEYAEATIRLRDWHRDGTPPDTGRYRVRSFFNGREGASTEFEIRP